MKRVLLTGANGFIGSHCVPFLLNKGFEVYAITSKNNPPSSVAGIHWISLDLLDANSVAELFQQKTFSHLLHFAWFLVPGECYTSLENFKWVQASLQLLRSFSDQGGKRVVFAGSCAEYDWRYGFCNEQLTPLCPSSTYGICKNALQGMYGEFVKQAGLSGAWGRIFFLYGPSEHPSRLVSSVISSLLQQKTAPCSHCRQIRDYMYVEDVAAAFVALLESDVQGAVNVCTGKPVALREIVEKVAAGTDGKDLLQIGALQSTVNEPPLLIGDARRLESEVGFVPKYSLEEGINKTISWWREALARR